MSVTTADGECGAGSTTRVPVLFSISQGQASDGTEVVFTSRNCTAVIEVSNVEEAWTLEFEKVE